MRIELVQLENMRSHVKSTIPFARGFNCLVGGLGTGKSTILYSIDFALFGDPIGRSYEYLLRENSDAGKVTVQFEQNGHNYTITRGLKRRGKSISQNFEDLKFFEGEKLLSSLKGDAVAEQIKAITGLDGDIFREIVWMRQEHLKELLDVTPRERQKKLDELFGLSDYETAWTNILTYQREYETERRVYERDPDITGMPKLGIEYDRNAQELTENEMRLQDSQERLSASKKLLAECDLKLQRLEEIREKSEEIKYRQTEILTNLQNTRETLRSLELRFSAKQKKVEALKQVLETMEIQAKAHNSELLDIGISAEQPIETIRQHLTTFDEQITDLKAQQEATRRGIREGQNRITSLSTEDCCPLCLQQLSDQYKTSLMTRIQQENVERQRSITQGQMEIDGLQQTRKKASTAFSGLQALLPRIEDQKARIIEEQHSHVELTQESEKWQKMQEQLEKELQDVRMWLDKFDTSELEDLKKQREDIWKQHYGLRAECTTLENHKNDLADRMSNLKERIDQTQQKIERMQKTDRAISLITGIREAYRSIQPKIRSEFVKVLRNFAQRILDDIAGEEGPLLSIQIDDSYTPLIIGENGVERDAANLSGGERTLFAFAYRLGLGQLIMQSRTGHGLSIVLLDEPTESLGREDRSIDRLAEAISRFKAIEQIIAVTHNEAFAEKAEHVMRLEKEAGLSRISVEK